MGQVAKDKIEIGVVLQGGGALGAYEFGAIIALLELMDDNRHSGQDRAVDGSNRSFDWCDQCGLRGRRQRSGRRAKAPAFPVVRSVAGGAEVLVGCRKPRSRVVRCARLLFAAPGCLEFLQLDELLRHRSDARNAEEARGLRFAERQLDRLCHHRGRCVLRRADPLPQSSTRDGSKDRDRPAPRAGERQPAAGISGNRDQRREFLGRRDRR